MFCKNEHEWRFATGISERIVDNNWLSNPATLYCTLLIITITINNRKIRIKYSFWIRIAIFLETFDTIWKGCIELNSCNTENKNYCRKPTSAVFWEVWRRWRQIKWYVNLRLSRMQLEPRGGSRPLLLRLNWSHHMSLLSYTTADWSATE